MDAIDYVLGNQILKFAKSQKTMNLDKQMADIKHDLEQQEKAKEEVIIRANSLRNLGEGFDGSEPTRFFQIRGYRI